MDEQRHKQTGICTWCNGLQWADVEEIHMDTNTFTVGDACCETFLNQLHDDFEFAAGYLKPLVQHYTGQEIRGVATGDGLNMKQKIKSIKQSIAKEFVREHHRHNPPPAGWRFGAGIWNWNRLIGVVMVGRPVARLIDHETTLEVNRLCIDDTINSDLTRHACSQAYAWTAREGRKRGFNKIITYTLSTDHRKSEVVETAAQAAPTRSQTGCIK